MKKNDYLVILAPMLMDLGLQGNSLLVFALIHGFTKDGSHKFVGSFQYIAEWLQVSERSVKEIISNLIHDGYITRTQELNDRRRPINVYTSNYDELLSRVAAGENVKPTSIKSRRSSKKVNSAQCAPLVTTDVDGAHDGSLMVHKVPVNGAQNAHNKYIDNDRDNNNSLSESARAREAEEREFYKIFFLRNAADPAAEVRRFKGYYQSQKWASRDGKTIYETLSQRCGLAYAWDFKGGERLPKCTATDDFYKLLDELYHLAQRRGGIAPEKILDTKGGYWRDTFGNFYWKCTEEVGHWAEDNKDILRQFLPIYIGKGINLYYSYYAAS